MGSERSMRGSCEKHMGVGGFDWETLREEIRSGIGVADMGNGSSRNGMGGYGIKKIWFKKGTKTASFQYGNDA